MTGTLHLVGVGPGDPELLTLKAARLLAAVPVVAYPTTGEAASALALARSTFCVWIHSCSVSAIVASSTSFAALASEIGRASCRERV